MATMGAVPGPLLSLALVLAIDSPAMQVQSHWCLVGKKIGGGSTNIDMRSYLTLFTQEKCRTDVVWFI